MSFKEILFTKYNFTQTDWENTIQFFKAEELISKELFLKEKEISNKLALIKTGFLRTYIINDMGNEVTTNFHLAGTVVLSIDSFNNRVPSKENIVAAEQTALLTLNFNDLKKLYQLVPSWQQICMDVAEIKNQKLTERSLEFQTLTAFERYQNILISEPKIIQKATVGQIASYLGIDIATLSRIRNKL